MRHFAGQGGQCRLGRGIGRPCKGMHARPCNRGHVDHRPLRGCQFCLQRPGQHDAGEEVDVKDMAPGAQVGVQRGQTRAARAFRADACIVHQSMQATVDLALDHLDRCDGLVGVGKIDLDVVFLAARPGTARIKGLPRTGQHPPALGRKPFDRGVPDAPACPGQQQRLYLWHHRFAPLFVHSKTLSLLSELARFPP